MEKKKIYEWVIVLSKGDELYLTENQFKYYQEHREEGVVGFDNFEINPSFVVQGRRREAEVINLLYPCKICHTAGHTLKEGESGSTGVFVECENCQGTGVDFKK